MKAKLSILCTLSIGLALSTTPILGFLPEPGAIYYGLIRGADGRQMTAADGVRLLMQTSRTAEGTGKQEDLTVAETEVITSPPGEPNFVLRPALDGGGQNRYTPLALRPGEVVRVVLVRSGVTNQLVGPIPVVGGRGSIQSVTLTAGCADTDHDGLCDEWEMRYFGSLTSTDGTKDSDNDGQTDLQEQAAGTNPLIPDGIEPLVLRPLVHTGNSVTVEWRRLVGKSYRLESTPAIGTPFGPVPPADIKGPIAGPGSVEVNVAGKPKVFLRVVEQ